MLYAPHFQSLLLSPSPLLPPQQERREGRRVPGRQEEKEMEVDVKEEEEEEEEMEMAEARRRTRRY